MRAAARVAELRWIGQHRRAVWADLLAVFHVEQPLALPAPTFTALAELAPYYQGAVAAALEAGPLSELEELQAQLATISPAVDPTSSPAGRLGPDTGARPPIAPGGTQRPVELGPDGRPVPLLTLTPGTSRSWGGDHVRVADPTDDGGRWAALARANGLDPELAGVPT